MACACHEGVLRHKVIGCKSWLYVDTLTVLDLWQRKPAGATDILSAALGHVQVYRGMLDAARGIVAAHGVAGLYRGLSITLLEIVPYAALQFGVYDALTAAVVARRRRAAAARVWSAPEAPCLLCHARKGAAHRVISARFFGGRWCILGPILTMRKSTLIKLGSAVDAGQPRPVCSMSCRGWRMRSAGTAATAWTASYAASIRRRALQGVKDALRGQGRGRMDRVLCGWNPKLYPSYSTYPKQGREHMDRFLCALDQRARFCRGWMARPAG